MTNQFPNPTEYSTTPVTLIITTYELAEEHKGHYFWKPTLTHAFHGETEERAYQISEAHKRTDAFYKGSFEGIYNGIALKNSEFQTIKS